MAGPEAEDECPSVVTQPAATPTNNSKASSFNLVFMASSWCSEVMAQMVRENPAVSTEFS
jgi:hypothetical protein